MKRNLLLFSLVFLLGAALDHIVRYNGIDFISTNLTCPSGHACIYRDSADGVLKIHLPDNTIAKLSQEIYAPATHGVSRFGALSTGATTTTPFRFQPNEPDAAPFEFVFSQFDNVFPETRKNQVMSWGLNVNQAVSAEAQFQFTLESLYNGVTEFHIDTNRNGGGASLRPFTLDLSRSSGIVTQVFRPQILQIQKAADNAILWSLNTGEGMWTSGNLGAFPAFTVTNADAIPFARVNGVDMIGVTTSPLETQISQENTATRTMSRETILGRANFDGSTANLSARLTFMRGQNAPVCGNNQGCLRVNGSTGKLEYSWSTGAYVPISP